MVNILSMYLLGTSPEDPALSRPKGKAQGQRHKTKGTGHKAKIIELNLSSSYALNLFRWQNHLTLTWLRGPGFLRLKKVYEPKD
jgi:hypothetical protein